MPTNNWQDQGFDDKGNFARKGDEPLSKPYHVRLPIPVADKIEKLPNRSEWLRRVIVEAANALP
jgi:hypothetical protein